MDKGHFWIFSKLSCAENRVFDMELVLESVVMHAAWCPAGEPLALRWSSFCSSSAVDPWSQTVSWLKGPSCCVVMNSRVEMLSVTSFHLCLVGQSHISSLQYAPYELTAFPHWGLHVITDYPTSMEPGKMKSVNISPYSLWDIAVL